MYAPLVAAAPARAEPARPASAGRRLARAALLAAAVGALALGAARALGAAAAPARARWLAALGGARALPRGDAVVAGARGWLAPHATGALPAVAAGARRRRGRAMARPSLPEPTRAYPPAMLFTPRPLVKLRTADGQRKRLRLGCTLRGTFGAPGARPPVLELSAGPFSLEPLVRPLLSRGARDDRAPAGAPRTADAADADAALGGYRAYNPSLARFSRGRGFVLSFRIDWQHGCSVQPRGVPRQFDARAGERFTALLLVDGAFRPLHHRPALVLDACARAHAHARGGRAADGEADEQTIRDGARARAPALPRARPSAVPWLSGNRSGGGSSSTRLMDVRLARRPSARRGAADDDSARASTTRGDAESGGSAGGEDDELWLTYLPAADGAFALAPPSGVRAEPRDIERARACEACCFACKLSTHVARLRVDVPRARGRGAWSAQLERVTPICAPELRGRNHALFFGADGRGGPDVPKVQAWLHPALVIGAVPAPAGGGANARAGGSGGAGGDARAGGSGGAGGDARAGGSGGAGGDARAASGAARALQLDEAGDDGAMGPSCKRLRFAGTTSLVRVTLGARGPHGRAAALLGVGHAHHGRAHSVAYFGSHYMHFFYALDAAPPHALLAHSAEWCLPHSASDARCEAVQFVTGLELAPDGRTVLLAYGVNDCESKLAVLPLERVRRMLTPNATGPSGSTGHF
ncbi:hypothetical protein KFE25_006579 [Diacronema lutheri]|uniref:Uncharacterized protein n=1 Tax=Diacronema lutheri TaxID=2081491 RepID=A0A8J5XE63_DIALT|nr:hypothetical protein KFE25_006579 [Diacronema lutheri]